MNENSITINGTTYVLVGDTEGVSCSGCALQKQCDEIEPSLLCHILFDAGDSDVYFVEATN